MQKIGLCSIFQEILISKLSITENVFMGHEKIFKKINKKKKKKTQEVLKIVRH